MSVGLLLSSWIGCTDTVSTWQLLCCESGIGIAMPCRLVLFEPNGRGGLSTGCILPVWFHIAFELYVGYVLHWYQTCKRTALYRRALLVDQQMLLVSFFAHV